MKYGELFSRVLSWHYLMDRGQDLWNVVGKQFDTVRNWARAGVKASMLEFAPPEALPFLAQNYNLALPEHFDEAQKREMIGDAWDIWEHTASHEGLIREVERLGFSRVAILPTHQARHTSDGVTDIIEIVSTVPGAGEVNPLFFPSLGENKRDIATDGRWTEGWWDELNYHYTSFFVVVSGHPFAFRLWSEWRWGEGLWDALVTGDRTLLNRLKETIRLFKGYNDRCGGILFTYSGTYIAGSLTPPFMPVAQYAVYSLRSFETWSVGAGGSVFYWNGVGWSFFASGTGEDLRAVYAQSKHDAWFAGDNGTIIHWNGTAMVPTTSGTNQRINGIVGVAGRMWAVGNAGTILLWDGKVWNPIASGTAENLNGIYAFGRDDIWAVGDAGTVLHWDGTTWSANAPGVAQNLYGVYGFALMKPTSLWVVGQGGVILAWDGAAWGAVVIGTEDLHSVWISKDSEILAVGKNGTYLRWTAATSWTIIPDMPPVHLWGVHGTGARNVWIVGDEGYQLWGSSDGRLFWGGPYGGFKFGDGTRYNLKYALVRMREPWET